MDGLTDLYLEGLTRTDALELEEALPVEANLSPSEAGERGKEAHYELGTAAIVMAISGSAIGSLLAFFGRRKSKTSVRMIHRKRDAKGATEELEFVWDEQASDSVNMEGLTHFLNESLRLAAGGAPRGDSGQS